VKNLLVTLGVSHKTAPIEIREKVAFSQQQLPEALQALAQQLPLEEVALLSTCNRTEFYCSVPANEPLLKEVHLWWQQYQAMSFDMQPYLYTFADEGAVQHMMRVASGLDSMVVGEPQILGQLKSAFRTAYQMGYVGKKLSRLFQTSFSVAKKVRYTTGISQHPVSIAYAAASLAKQIFSDLSTANVVLIGAGENVELTLQHLTNKKIKKLFIVNRTLSHAQRLSERFGGQALPLTQLTSALAQADIVISSIDCAKPFLTQNHIDRAFAGQKRRPVLMVDLGVPRNIDPVISQNEDIYLYSIDDLQGIVDQNLNHRHLAAKDAESVILDASDNYMRWISSQPQVQVVRALRSKVEVMKQEALNIALKRLKKGEDPHKVLTSFAHQLTQKMLHQPTVGLKDRNLDKNHDKMVLIKELFSIE
jgi:glutamyl-tRNA reductase